MRLPLKCLCVFAAILFCSIAGVYSQQLYVGANYHPHDDKNIEKIKKDIQLMKDAGFNVVRMGHLHGIVMSHQKGNLILPGLIRLWI